MNLGVRGNDGQNRNCRNCGAPPRYNPKAMTPYLRVACPYCGTADPHAELVEWVDQQYAAIVWATRVNDRQLAAAVGANAAQSPLLFTRSPGEKTLY